MQNKHREKVTLALQTLERNGGKVCHRFLWEPFSMFTNSQILYTHYICDWMQVNEYRNYAL